jgi:hypothetical protein
MNETQHSFLVDCDLSILTVKIDGYISFALNLTRPDGTAVDISFDCLLKNLMSNTFKNVYECIFSGSVQDFTENGTIDVIRDTAIISIQVTFAFELKILK